MRGLTRLEVELLEDASIQLESWEYELEIDNEPEMSPEESRVADQLLKRGLLEHDPQSRGSDQFYNITALGRIALAAQRAVDNLSVRTWA